MTKEATPEQVVEFMTNVMKTTPEQIITMLRAEVERLDKAYVRETAKMALCRAEVERLYAERLEQEQEWVEICVERERPLRAEVERLKELFALKWDATQSAETEAARTEVKRLRAAYAEMARMWKASNARILELAPEIGRLTALVAKLRAGIGLVSE